MNTNYSVDFPFHFESRGRTALAYEQAHICDMIEQFLFTNPGERVNRPDFGSGLLSMIFEPNSSELATALQETVKAGLQRWLGDLIEVRDLVVVSNEATLQVSIRYRIRRTNEIHTGIFERSSV